ncbi:uracil-DNA glycosylase [Halobacillus sp. BBL2006]|uniref:uracil-DNA glycosylase n=1 Tax=Halobacillus sp. BBL2006 TaxID=1543706 RepID=UPI0005434086|nr:uracil-DNA glycosylase [Halobacillus sp. BBL2006]KHE70065.1 uracil-DNA glycosylase [Halobacillus sp. BBL2006]
MEFPDHLIEEAKIRMEPHDVEGFVLGQGDTNGEVMLVGEAPGENEAVEGRPFIGRAGKELDKQLTILGLAREDIYITSVVRSRPYKWVKTNKKDSGGKRKANRKPNQKEINAHAPLLDYQIETMNPKIIITLGGVAFERVTGRKDKISEIIGQVLEMPVMKVKDIEAGVYEPSDQVYQVIPLYHPAAVFYNPKIKQTIDQSLDQVKRYLS